MSAPSSSILVSACLLGVATRHDGAAKRNQQAIDWLAEQNATPIPVCPEQLAGQPTPRPRCRFTRGDGEAVLDGTGEILDESGRRMNEFLLRGASETLKIARICNCRIALLKEGSPSCGVSRIDRNGERASGAGVATALLQRNGLEVLSEETL